MERTITYKITDSGQNIRIDSFLRKHGYSMQNLTLLKKMPESILKNGEWSYTQTTLQAGDILTVRIQEETSSPNIPAVNLPIDIVYEDEDIIVINKAAGMPIHPSLNNYRNSLANALMWYYEQQNKPFIFRCTNRLDRIYYFAEYRGSSERNEFLAVLYTLDRRNGSARFCDDDHFS